MEGSRIPTPIKQMGLRLIERCRAFALPGAGSAAIVLAALALDESGAGFLAARPAAAAIPLQRSEAIMLIADSGQVPRPAAVGPPVVLFSPATRSSAAPPDPPSTPASPSTTTVPQKPMNKAAVPAKPPSAAPAHPAAAAPAHPAAVPATAKPLIPPAALPARLGPPPEARTSLPLDTDLQPLDGAAQAPQPGGVLPSGKPPQ